DAFREVWDLFGFPFRKIPGFTGANPILVLICTTPFDSFGGNPAGIIWQLVHHQLPHRQDMYVPIAQYPDIQFTPFDVLFNQGPRSYARVNEFYPLLELVVILNNGRLRDSKGSLLGH